MNSQRRFSLLLIDVINKDEIIVIRATAVFTLVLRLNFVSSVLFLTCLIIAFHRAIALRCVWVIINIAKMAINLTEHILVQVSADICVAFFVVVLNREASSQPMPELPFLLLFQKDVP